MQYTCNRCGTRNVNQVNPTAWKTGTIFIECGGCKVRHKLIDNLGIVHEMQLDVFKEHLAVAREKKLRRVMPTSMLPM
jgi:transcription elongation factor Elf1